MLTNNTGTQLWPLSTGSSDNPTLTQNSPVTFNLDSLPTFQGALAYYLMGVWLTIAGNVVQAGGAGSLIPTDALTRALVDSIELRNAWHGTPISVNNVKGAMLPIIEYVGNGYRYGSRVHNMIPSGNGTYPFQRTFFIPLAVGCGQKPHQTAQLALFYRKAQFVINVAASSVISGLSTGSSLTALSARCSAAIMPDPELRLGPGSEWVDYQVSASANQSQIQLLSFGNNTALSGTERGAGVVFLGALSSVGGLGGSFQVGNLTKFSFPWRGQFEVQQIAAYVGQQMLSMGPQRAAFGNTPEATVLQNGLGSDFSGFPYQITNDVGNGVEFNGLMFFPMVTPTNDLELSKVQVADGDQSYFMTGPSFSGTHHTLCQQVRSWEALKIEDAARQMVDSGLAKRVLGTNNVTWSVKTLNKNAASLNPKKARFFPLRLVERRAA